MTILLADFHVSPRDIDDMRVTDLAFWLENLAKLNRERNAA